LVNSRVSNSQTYLEKQTKKKNRFTGMAEIEQQNSQIEHYITKVEELTYDF
jgi:uncharacterized protein YdeI (YjbR/CyaY-like superfamily)